MNDCALIHTVSSIFIGCALTHNVFPGCALMDMRSYMLYIKPRVKCTIIHARAEYSRRHFCVTVIGSSTNVDSGDVSDPQAETTSQQQQEPSAAPVSSQQDVPQPSSSSSAGESASSSDGAVSSVTGKSSKSNKCYSCYVMILR